MNAHHFSDSLFHTEVMQGIYQISSDTLNPTDNKKSFAPGNPTRNSYLVIGKEKALLFDLALEEQDLKEYAEHLAGMPVQLVLSHGHLDHTYHLNRFSAVWMHPADESLIRAGCDRIEQLPVTPCPIINYLTDGDSIDLGQRILDVFHVPGHTDGSILLLDRKTGTLLSGDTCARRLLYGLHGFVSLQDFCDSLRHLQMQSFDIMYSAHDRCALPKAYLEHMIDSITNELPQTQTKFEVPEVGMLSCYTKGNVHSISYFDVALPAQYIKC